MSPVGRTNNHPGSMTRKAPPDSKINLMLGLSPQPGNKQQLYNSPAIMSKANSMNIPEFRNGTSFNNTALENSATSDNNQLDETIKDLDVKLNRVLMKQEYDYLKGYNIYVKRKEKELRDLIQKLSDRTAAGGNALKDEKSQMIEVHQLREQAVKQDQVLNDLKQKIKFWKNKAETYESEKAFLHKQTLDTKKKNKLLKVAVGKLQQEVERLTKGQEQKEKDHLEQQKSQFFITDLLNLAEQSTNQINTSGIFNSHAFNSLKHSPRMTSQPTTQNGLESTNLQELSTMQQSLIENPSMQKSKTIHKRYQSLGSTSSVSRYANIPTENIKFEKFIELLYKSKMTKDEIQTEVKAYVQVLETNYNDTIKELRAHNERLIRKIKKTQGSKVNAAIEKNELESLFLECIEDVRKEIMKRRLKNEINQKKKGLINLQNFDSAKNDEDAREFEESLIKLAALAKNKIKLSDFNSSDRFNILQLFVENKKTLIKIYEALFQNQISTQNASKIGQGTNSNSSGLGLALGNLGGGIGGSNFSQIKNSSQKLNQSFQGSNSGQNTRSQSFKTARGVFNSQTQNAPFKGSNQVQGLELSGTGVAGRSGEFNLNEQSKNQLHQTELPSLNNQNELDQMDPNDSLIIASRGGAGLLPTLNTDFNQSGMFPKIGSNSSTTTAANKNPNLNDPNGIFGNRYQGANTKQL